MTKKYKNPKKPNIVSLRISDDEMEIVQQVMELTDSKASDLLRDAFALIRARWEMSLRADAPLEN